jgi:hypothetical protein
MEGYKGKCQNLEGNYRKYILDFENVLKQNCNKIGFLIMQPPKIDILNMEGN